MKTNFLLQTVKWALGSITTKKASGDDGIPVELFKSSKMILCKTLFSWPPKSLQAVTAAMKLKDPCSLGEKLLHLDSILKSRDITLPTKVRLAKAMVFPVVMYGCESCTIKKVEEEMDIQV